MASAPPLNIDKSEMVVTNLSLDSATNGIRTHGLDIGIDVHLHCVVYVFVVVEGAVL